MSDDDHRWKNAPPGYHQSRDALDRARGCDGKEQLDRAAAEARVHQLKKKDPRGTSKLCAYECRHCKRWHVGNLRPGTDR